MARIKRRAVDSTFHVISDNYTSKTKMLGRGCVFSAPNATYIRLLMQESRFGSCWQQGIRHLLGRG